VIQKDNRDSSRSNRSCMVLPGAHRDSPWCPNCKEPLTLDDVGTLQRSQASVPRFWTSVLFCKKCGVILGGSGT